MSNLEVFRKAWKNSKLFPFSYCRYLLKNYPETFDRNSNDFGLRGLIIYDAYFHVIFIFATILLLCKFIKITVMIRMKMIDHNLGRINLYMYNTVIDNGKFLIDMFFFYNNNRTLGTYDMSLER